MDLRTTTGYLAACGVIVSTLACGSAGTAPAKAPIQAGVRVVADEPEPVDGIAEAGFDAYSDELAPNEIAEVEGDLELAPADALAESLAEYESATALWKQGEIDDAFTSLDHAYELMATVSPDDETMAQDKENLRHLIGRRVVEIYASRQTSVGDLDRSIPRVMNDEVRREIASFTGREREFFLESYRRSGRYRPMIVTQLQAAGMPEQLSWLPLVESGFKSRALSSARALGLWQFIPSTGYRYGLERDTWIDERMDPEKATLAAIGYLTDLHGLFGDWLTALAAYNCGENAVLRQINRQSVAYFDRFWDLYALLPGETRRYVPRFLAVLEIIENPDAYGIELPEPYAPAALETVEVTRAADLGAIERAAGTPTGLLSDLNPELRMKATPDASYSLRVPAGSGETVLASLESLPIAPAEPPKPEVLTHRVRPGDNLWRLASRYGTTVDSIRHANGLRGNVLRPGQTLIVRASGSAGTGGTGSSAAVDTVYTVRRGDTLGSIAQRQGVSLKRLLSANRLSSRSVIQPGQRIRIPR